MRSTVASKINRLMISMGKCVLLLKMPVSFSRKFEKSNKNWITDEILQLIEEKQNCEKKKEEYKYHCLND